MNAPKKETWRIDTWLQDWIDDHGRAFPAAGWPAPDGAAARKIWSLFFDAFKAAKVTEDEAREASAEMQHDGLWCEEHPAAIVETIQILRRENAGKAERGGAEAMSAAEQSRGCPLCSGSGQAIAYDPKFDGRSVVDRRCRLPSGEIKVIPYAMKVAAHCVCPMGRWLRGKCDKEVLPRVPDMEEVLAGKSRWQAKDPTTGDEHGPIELPEGVADYCKYWRHLVEKLCEGEGGGVVQVRDGRPVR